MNREQLAHVVRAAATITGDGDIVIIGSSDGTFGGMGSHKSFKPKDGPPSEPPVGRNAEVGWHGEKRSERDT